jgi:RNA polymerase sigma factor (sigma-70 family)
MLSAEIRDHLGQQLRAVYESSETPQEMPERLRSLIGRLERVANDRGRTDLEFRQGILAAIPHLRAFANSLTFDPDRADDLVQDTVLRAWQNSRLFEPGTNLIAWLFTILRNAYYTEHRKRARMVEDADGLLAARLASPAGQMAHLELQDLRSALMELPTQQREVLLLVAAQGLSYEEVAEICSCRVGTIKSRINRARTRLSELLGYGEGEIGS